MKDHANDVAEEMLSTDEIAGFLRCDESAHCMNGEGYEFWKMVAERMAETIRERIEEVSPLDVPTSMNVYDMIQCLGDWNGFEMDGVKMNFVRNLNEDSMIIVSNMGEDEETDELDIDKDSEIFNFTDRIVVYGKDRSTKNIFKKAEPSIVDDVENVSIEDVSNFLNAGYTIYMGEDPVLAEYNPIDDDIDITDVTTDDFKFLISSKDSIIKTDVDITVTCHRDGIERVFTRGAIHKKKGSVEPIYLIVLDRSKEIPEDLMHFSNLEEAEDMFIHKCAHYISDWAGRDDADKQLALEAGYCEASRWKVMLHKKK
jgi:hypothetical protein